MPLPGISVHPLVPSPPEAGFVTGLLFAWGNSVEGKLGDGQAAVNFSSPIAVGSQSWRTISCGGGNGIGEGHGHTLAVRSDFLLFAWGDNGQGQLGDTTTTDRSSPVQIGSSSWISVSASASSSYAIRIDGLLFAWGENTAGSVGDGTITQRLSPVQIGASSWKFVCGGVQCAFGIDINGRLFSWGAQLSGQLGDAGATRSSPVQIGTSSWTMVSASRTSVSAMGLRIDGLLFAWGSNTSGALGVNSATASFSSPVAIGASSWVHCVMSGNNVGGAAVNVAAQLFGWGSQSGTGVATSSPVQLGAALGWKTVWGGDNCKFAIASDNTLWAWGSNAVGQFGDGTVVSKTSPIQIGASGWKEIGCGANNAVPAVFTIGLKLP